jgi:hypothetical protein
MGMEPGRPPDRSTDDLGMGQSEIAGNEADRGVVGPVPHCLGNRFRLTHRNSEWL